MPPKDAAVFISYARQDEDLARVMRDRLSDAGIASVVDTGTIAVGDDWRLVAKRQIDTAPSLVVLCTPRSMASHEVTTEWAYAMGLGITVIPVLYKSGLRLPSALAPLEHLDFSTSRRDWSKLTSSILAGQQRGYVTRAVVQNVGISRMFTDRNDLLAHHSLRQIILDARSGSVLLAVGRSLEAWSREFQHLQDAINTKDLCVRMALVDPALPPDDWMVPGDYALMDLPSSVAKFERLVPPVGHSKGSFELYFLPNSPLFSFIHYEDAVGACAILELGANLSFEGRVSLVLRGRDTNLLNSLREVHEQMLATRKPQIRLKASAEGRSG